MDGEKVICSVVCAGEAMSWVWSEVVVGKAPTGSGAQCVGTHLVPELGRVCIAF